jgi:hypothetical protein
MPYPDGTLLRSSDQPEVWLIQGGQRHWIPSPEVFNSDGFSWAAILVVSDADITAIPQGTDVPLYTTWVTPGPNDAPVPGAPALPVVEYNGADYKRWKSAGGGHTIYANGKFVTQTGVFQGATVTSNSVVFTGYHSGTAALVADPNGRVIWTSNPLFRVGVNPQGFSGNAQVTVNAWEYQVPGNIADQAGGINIVLTDSPDNLQDILNHSVGALISDLAPAIAAIGGILGGSKKSGTQTQKTTASASARKKAWTTVPADNGHEAAHAPEDAGAHAEEAVAV